MRFIECEPNSEEWYQNRAGLITASMFSAVCEEIGGLNEQQRKYVDAVLSGLEKKEAANLAGYKAIPNSTIIDKALRGELTADYSETAKRYATDLAIERISGNIYRIPAEAWVLRRGHEQEPHARRIYEARTGAFVTEAGICVDDNGFGYSTDGLVEDDGLSEIKCPVDSLKIEHILKTGDTSEYDHQIQGGMWLTHRKWCDFIMYVPALESIDLDLYVKRIYRDEEFIDAMVMKLHEFSNYVKEKEHFFRNFLLYKKAA
jgi:hypothetical protein